MTTIGRSLFRTADFRRTGAEAVGVRNERSNGDKNERAAPAERHSRFQTSRYSERSQDTAFGSIQRDWTNSLVKVCVVSTPAARTFSRDRERTFFTASAPSASMIPSGEYMDMEFRRAST